MGTIHKLTKGGATIFPATVTDAVVHPDTKAVITSMLNEYNVSVLFPTEGESNTRVYTLAGAVAKLSAELTADYKVLGTKVYFETGQAQGDKVVCYCFSGTTFSNPAHWKKIRLSTEEIEASLNDLNYNISALINEAEITLTATPQRVIAGESTTITVNASVSKFTPDSISLYQNEVLIATVTGQATISGSATDTFSADQVFKVVVSYYNYSYEKSITVPATGAAYYGYASAVSDVITPLTSSTVKGRYTVTCPADDLFLFFIVPVEMEQPIGFRVGGVEVAMIKWEADLSPSESNNSSNSNEGEGGEGGDDPEPTPTPSNTHWIYRTSAQYDQGTTLTIDVY